MSAGQPLFKGIIYIFEVFYNSYKGRQRGTKTSDSC